MLSEKSPPVYTDLTPHHSVEQQVVRGNVIAEATRDAGIHAEYTPLADSNYEGLYILHHESAEPDRQSEPTMRLYRGIASLDSTALDQKPYALRDRHQGENGQESNDLLRLAAVEQFIVSPTYTNLRRYALLAGAAGDERTADTIAGRLHKIENAVLAGYSLAEGLVDAHIASRVGIGDVDISPFVSTTLDPENAQRYGGGAVLVMDIPVSQVYGAGEHGEVLVAGKIGPECITAIAVKRNEHVRYGINRITDSFPATPGSDTKAIPENPRSSPAAEDLESVSQIRSAQLLDATPPDVRNKIAIPNVGPEMYVQLQKILFDHYLTAVPNLVGQLYRGQNSDPDYMHDPGIDVFDRRSQPYEREKVTDGMLGELLKEYHYNEQMVLRCKQRVGRSALTQ